MKISIHDALSSKKIFAAIQHKERSILLLLTLIASFAWGLTGHSQVPDIADSRQYTWAAWHILHDGTYSEAPHAGPVEAGMGREPGYPLIVAAMLKVMPGLDKITVDCLSREEGCGYQAWRPALFCNGIFIGLAGLCTFWIVHILGFSRLAAWLGALHIWCNGQAAKGREYLLSDHLAMLLVALASLTLVWAYQKGGWRWAIAGLALAVLSLTKAIFLFAVVPALLIAVIVLILRKQGRSRHLAALAMFTMAYALPVGAWMERNNIVGGAFAITSGRSAIALSTREVFDHMTPTQYAAAFVYWTRAMGDGLAKSFFAPEVWKPFEIDNPDGFYNVGQNRTQPLMAQLMTEQGLSAVNAEKVLTQQMIHAILGKPIAYALTTLPLIWRGIWVDDFIVWSFPALIWLAWSIARKRLDVALAISLGGFSLIFYAMASLNIPRYQLTAIPSLAIGFGIGMTALINLYRNRHTRTIQQQR